MALGAWALPLLATADIAVDLQGDPGAATLDGGFLTITSATHTLVQLNSSDGIHFRLENPISDPHLFWPEFEFVPRPGDALVGMNHFAVYRPVGAANAKALVQSVQNPCSYGEGWFYVYQFERDPVVGITKLAMEFQFRCSGYTGILRGRIQINSTVVIPDPTLTALANGPLEASEGDTVQLEGKWSRRGQYPIASYSWRQVSGPAVQLQNADTAEPTFVAVTPSDTTSVARFELTVTDSAGNTAVGDTETRVIGSNVPQTFFAMQSDPNEYVLRGQSYTLRDPDVAIVPKLFNYERQEIQIDSDYDVWIAAPEGQLLAPGTYENAASFPSPTAPRLWFYGGGSACNSEIGQFTIYEIAINPTTQTVDRLAFDFDRRCNSNPDSDQRAYGQVRINSSVPRLHTTPLSVAGADRQELEQSPVTLDGSGSRAGGAAITTWEWTQTAGPSVMLSDPGVVKPQFTTPAVASGSATLTFQLRVTDANGNTNADTVNVLVLSSSQPRDGLLIDGRAGDYVGEGQYLTLDDDDGQFLARRNADASITFAINAAQESFAFTIRAKDNGELTVDNYEDASDSPARPGVSANTLGRACNASTGRFTVRELVYAPGSSTIQRLAVDLEHYCDGETEPLYAAFRFNSSIPLSVAEPTAAAGSDQSVMERTRVTLDGRHSQGGSGTISSWQWRQVSGPAVTLSNAATSRAQFDAPVGADPQSLRFELLTTNSSGLSDTDTVDVHVSPRTAPQSFATVSGVRSETLLPANGEFVALAVGTSVASVKYNAGLDSWSFVFAVGDGVPLTPGTYTVDGSSNPPSMDVADYVDCNTGAKGTFTVRDIAYSGDALTRLAVDFDQSCGSRAWRGKLRYNVPLPDANAGPDSTHDGRSAVSLSASASLPVSGGSLSSYSWRQLSGPTVTLTGATSSTASFTAPDVAVETPMEFELTVTDNRGIDATDTTITTIEPAPAVTPSPGGSGGGAGGAKAGSGGGGSWDWICLAVLGAMLCRRRLARL